MNKIKISSILLGASMFFTGASGIIIQNILSVTSSSILGNTFVQFAVTISIMMGSMGIGSYLQKYLNGKLLRYFVLTEIFLFFITVISPLFLYSVYVYAPSHFSFFQYLITFSVGTLIGLEIPLISRINQKYQPDLKRNIGNIFLFDYIGSMIGGLMWAYLIIGRMDLTDAAFLTGSLNLLVALITIMYFENTSKGLYRKLSPFLICLLVIPLFSYKDIIHRSSSQRLYEEPIIFQKTTKYQNLVVTHDSEINDYRLFINGNLQFSSLDEKIYHEFLVDIPMRTAKERKNVLILGGGDGLALREVLEYEDVESVTLVDLDPEMISLFKNNELLSSLNGNSFKNSKVLTKEIPKTDTELKRRILKDNHKISEVTVYTIDAFNFIRDTDKLFDIIIIDFPDPNHVELSKLYSLEFYKHMANILTDEGVFSIQSTSPYHAKEAFWCIGRTLMSCDYLVIPYHYNIPSFGDWGWFVGTKNLMDIEDRLKRANFNAKTSFISNDIVSASLSFGKPLYHTENYEINTLLNPVLLHLYVEKSWKVE
jgi:spermidine synthase